MDGDQPECLAGECPITPLNDEAGRIMEIRSHLIGLQPTVDAGTICRIHNVDKDDLDLLLTIERELKESPPHGEGH